ncbi:type II toxin-antitoxin system YafQ family toxin [Mobiluncus mulieris]|uniref:Type II toxin-antitoxin system YafQ family toxin n=1 Tax=Mobiluncus mulieris TaxID=2052 RepID=A0A848RFR7_9ACTO|nr:addiction module toxin, RelE/StbE family [Mobiluncus mulieris ATCC 35243]MCU9971741.1 type II toxin-antitoxin system YafQ family toxin [Mobiluncus mulieris]NMW63348.1 type II toxin-antitoxin system YafQ family toxin [Mobiluncus mulieris]NMW90183.1 type II toxin-antitoxin system YafQ family toxin [Mobiluncus mulieris]NMW92720.1 type II toxin-antitoxin system YafQ family toxin [Mobiluncus mulieris]
MDRAVQKGLQNAMRRGQPMEELDEVIRLLAEGEELPEKYRDHALVGNWLGHRECHIRPNWLLIYAVNNRTLVLTLARTGTHSDLL